MYLPEPSGSSPLLNPPENARICAASISFAKFLRLAASSSGVRLQNTIIFVSAPFRLNARAMSYSQFVPGNTGMITRGFDAGRFLMLKDVRAFARDSCSFFAQSSSASCSFLPLTGGNTTESFSSQAFSILSRAIVVPKTLIDFSAVVSPSFTTVPSVKSARASRSSALSTMIEP